MLIAITTSPGHSQKYKPGTLQHLAINNAGHEATECAAYHAVVGGVLKGDKREPHLSEKYLKTGTLLLERAAILATMIDQKAAAIIARYKISIDEMMKAIDNSATNISILYSKYAYPCKAVVEKPDDRLRYWLKKAVEK